MLRLVPERALDILVVEDDDTIRVLLTEILGGRGQVVTACATAESAWTLLQKQQFDLIILDRLLGGMDGLELCRRIRALPHGIYSHILVLTDSPHHADLSATLAAGADDDLTPPFDPEALGRRLAIAERHAVAMAARFRVEEDLRASEERYRTLVEHLPTVTYIAPYGAEGIPLYVSPQIETLVGFTAAEWAAEPEFWITRVHPDDRARVLAADAHFTRTWEPQHVEYRHRARDGHTVWVQEDAVLVRDTSGQPLYILGIISDITARKEAEEALRASEQHLQALIESAPIGTCLVDEQDNFVTVNAAFCTLFGYTRNDVVGHPVTLLAASAEQSASATDLSDHLRGWGPAEADVALVAKGGRPLRVVSTRIQIPGPAGQLQRAFFIVDITERAQREQSLSHLAHFDALTGLPNRTLFTERVRQAVAQARRHKQIVALLFVDLDGFKEVNDTWGHAVGDALLQEVARCLRGTLRESDSVARLAGDEFAVVLPDIGNGAHAADVARKILLALGHGFVVDGHHLVPTASIGISLFPFAGQEPDALLKSADRAMYGAKRHGKNAFAFFMDDG